MTLKRKTKKYIFVAGMLVVPVASFIIFWGVVNVNSILLAFKRLEISTGLEYYTVQNFQSIPALFSKYGALRIAIQNTLLTWVFLMFLLPWSFFLTYFIYKKICLSGLWRIMLFVPSLMPAVAMTSIFMYIIYPAAPVGMLFKKILGSAPPFLSDTKYARWTVIIYMFWANFGGSFVLISGAMARIPKEMLESANIDGAGLRIEMLKIVLPLCWPTLSMIVLLNTTGIFTASGPILLLTGGKYDSQTVSFWIFDQIMNYRNYYIASAAGLIFTVVLFPIVLLTRWGLGKVYADVEF